MASGGEGMRPDYKRAVFSKRGYKRLAEAGIPRRTAEDYGNRWGLEGLIALEKNGVPLATANRYPHAFEAAAVIATLKYGITAEIALHYSYRAVEDIVVFTREGILPEVANQYNSDFHSAQIATFIKEGKSPQQANAELEPPPYPPRPQSIQTFEDMQQTAASEAPCRISFMHRHVNYRIGHSTQEMLTYSPKWSTDDIVSLMCNHVPPDVADVFYPACNGHSIGNLALYLAKTAIERGHESLAKSIGTRDSNEWHNKSDDLWEKHLQDKGMDALIELVRGGWRPPVSHRSIITEFEIRRLGLRAEDVRGYASEWQAEELLLLHDNCIPPATANSYLPRWTATETVALDRALISADKAHDYVVSGGATGIIALVENGIDATTVRRYSSDGTMTGEEIARIIKDKIDPITIKAYGAKDASEAYLLKKKNIGPCDELAFRGYSAKEIAFFVDNHLRPQDVRALERYEERRQIAKRREPNKRPCTWGPPNENEGKAMDVFVDNQSSLRQAIYFGFGDEELAVDLGIKGVDVGLKNAHPWSLDDIAWLLKTSLSPYEAADYTGMNGKTIALMHSEDIPLQEATLLSQRRPSWDFSNILCPLCLAEDAQARCLRKFGLLCDHRVSDVPRLKRDNMHLVRELNKVGDALILRRNSEGKQDERAARVSESDFSAVEFFDSVSREKHGVPSQNWGDAHMFMQLRFAHTLMTTFIYDHRDWELGEPPGRYPHKEMRDDWQSKYLRRAGLTEADCEGYATQFYAPDIVPLVKEGITASVANEFDERFSGDEIVALVKASVPPSVANAYRKTFTGASVCALQGVVPNKPALYPAPKKVADTSILDVLENGMGVAESSQGVSANTPPEGPIMVPPELANQYPERFDGESIRHLRKKDIMPNVANAYRSEYSFHEIIDFVEQGIPEDLANAYTPRWRHDWPSLIKKWRDARIEPSLVNAYPHRFSGWQVDYFLEYRVLPKVAQRLPQDTFEEHLRRFFKDVHLNKVLEFDERFSMEDRLACLAHGMQASEANKYHTLLVDKRLRHECLGGYKRSTDPSPSRSNIPTERTLGWGNRHSDSSDILLLAQSDVNQKTAALYDPRFSAADILFLTRNKIAPSLANAYPPRIPAEIIPLLQGMRFTPSILRTRYSRGLEDVLCRVALSDDLNPRKYLILGTGAHGIVLFNNGSARKFSDRAVWEHSILMAAQMGNGLLPSNVVIPLSDVIDGYTFEMERINGETLERQLSRGTISRSNARRYVRDVLNGLCELRRGGVIYHHDIKPANIMIERKTGRAVLIDCGIASQKPLEYDSIDDAIAARDNNKGYGVRDLPAVAQIAYRMETGTHLFSTSDTMETTSERLNIRDEREQAYLKPGGIEPYLKKVRDNVADKNYAEFIVRLLVANPDDVELMQEMSEGLFLGVGHGIIKARRRINSMLKDQFTMLGLLFAPRQKRLTGDELTKTIEQIRSALRSNGLT